MPSWKDALASRVETDLAQRKIDLTKAICQHKESIDHIKEMGFFINKLLSEISSMMTEAKEGL